MSGSFCRRRFGVAVTHLRDVSQEAILLGAKDTANCLAELAVKLRSASHDTYKTVRSLPSAPAAQRSALIEFVHGAQPGCDLGDLNRENVNWRIREIGRICHATENKDFVARCRSTAQIRRGGVSIGLPRLLQNACNRYKRSTTLR
jgi:hypothetical protein